MDSRTASPDDVHASVTPASASNAASTVVSFHADPENKSSYTIVTWDGPNDPENPRNWSLRRRWATTIIASLFAFMSYGSLSQSAACTKHANSPVASSMIAPSLPQLSADMNIQPGSMLQGMTLSIFVLAYAIGVLIWGPLSELLGRQLVLQVSNVFFLGPSSPNSQLHLLTDDAAQSSTSHAASRRRRPKCSRSGSSRDSAEPHPWPWLAGAWATCGARTNAGQP